MAGTRGAAAGAAEGADDTLGALETCGVAAGRTGLCGGARTVATSAETIAEAFFGIRETPELVPVTHSLVPLALALALALPNQLVDELAAPLATELTSIVEFVLIFFGI